MGQADGFVEVPDIPQVFFVLNQTDPDILRCGNNSLHNFHSPVPGAVITDHDLVHWKGLIQNRIQLTLYVPFPVVGRHGN